MTAALVPPARLSGRLDGRGDGADVIGSLSSLPPSTDASPAARVMGMSFLGLDTRPQAAEVQLGLLRKASVGRRAALARSLSTTVIGLSRQAVREAMKTATDAEVMNRWLALNYGEDLARRVRDYMRLRAR